MRSTTRSIIIVLILGLFLSGAHTNSNTIQKRSDDGDPLTAVVQQLSSTVTLLKARLDAIDHKVAFSAQFSAAHPIVRLSSAFRFDYISFNFGNAYDSQLGIFTAPLPGVYTFSVQFFTYGPERPVVDIRVNGHPTHRMALDTSLLGDSTNGEDSDSMTVILHLAQGDRVWVESITDNIALWGSIHSFFTGALLYTV